LKENIWDRYREADGSVSKVMVTMGNHEYAQKVEGKVDETLTIEQREAMLKDNWEHDTYYTSRVIKDKVMVIQIDNGRKTFREEQVPLLKADLQKARKNSNVVLLFYHVPLGTGNSEDTEVKSMLKGDAKSEIRNFYTGNSVMATHESTGVNGEVYELIVNNADVIAATFCGHLHNDYYTEMMAKTADGQNQVIPQYVLRGAPYSKGHALKITVK